MVGHPPDPGTPQSFHRTLRAPAVGILATFAGWLIVLPGGLGLIVLRLGAINADAQFTRYSLTLAMGWGVFIVCTALFGRLSDRLKYRRGDRLPLAWLSVPLVGLGGAWLALAPTTVGVSGAWIAVQIPLAAMVATSNAVVGDSTPARYRGIISGFLGVIPIAAALVGTVITSMYSTDVVTAVWWITGISVALMIPLLLTNTDAVSAPLHRRLPIVGLDAEQSAALHTSPVLWLAFLLMGFLVSWSTATANGYLVLFVTDASGMPQASVSTSTQLVAWGTAFALVSGLLGGLMSRRSSSPLTVYVVGTVLIGGSLLLVVAAPSIMFLFVAATLFGVGVGFTNGSELTIVLDMDGSSQRLGERLGALTATTSLPYVLVPLSAVVFMTGNEVRGLQLLFFVGGIAAVLASIPLPLLSIASARRLHAKGSAHHA